MKNICQMLLLCLLLTAGFAHPPFESWNIYKSIQSISCKSAVSVDSNYPSSDVEDLCQRCAKFTKSQNVYPMCCANTEDVQVWCHKAIEYGNQ